MDTSQLIWFVSVEMNKRILVHIVSCAVIDRYYLFCLIDFDGLLPGGGVSGCSRCVSSIMPTDLIWLFSSLLSVTGSIYSDAHLTFPLYNLILNKWKCYTHVRVIAYSWYSVMKLFIASLWSLSAVTFFIDSVERNKWKYWFTLNRRSWKLFRFFKKIHCMKLSLSFDSFCDHNSKRVPLILPTFNNWFCKLIASDK